MRKLNYAGFSDVFVNIAYTNEESLDRREKNVKVDMLVFYYAN